MPRPDLTSPGPRHGRQGPNNSVHESTKHGRPMSRRRGNLHLSICGVDSGFWNSEEPLISNPHLLVSLPRVCPSLSTVNSASIPFFVLFFSSPHRPKHRHTHTRTLQNGWYVSEHSGCTLHAARCTLELPSLTCSPQPSTDSPSWAARSPAAPPAARPSSSRRTPMMYVPDIPHSGIH